MNRAEKEQILGYVILGAIALAVILLIGLVIAGASNSAREMEEILNSERPKRRPPPTKRLNGSPQ